MNEEAAEDANTRLSRSAGGGQGRYSYPSGHVGGLRRRPCRDLVLAVVPNPSPVPVLFPDLFLFLFLCLFLYFLFQVVSRHLCPLCPACVGCRTERRGGGLRRSFGQGWEWKDERGDGMC